MADGSPGKQGSNRAARELKKAGPEKGPAIGSRRDPEGYLIRRRLVEIPSRQGLGGWVKLPVEDCSTNRPSHIGGSNGRPRGPNGAFSWLSAQAELIPPAQRAGAINTQLTSPLRGGQRAVAKRGPSGGGRTARSGGVGDQPSPACHGAVTKPLPPRLRSFILGGDGGRNNRFGPCGSALRRTDPILGHKRR